MIVGGPTALVAGNRLVHDGQVIDVEGFRVMRNRLLGALAVLLGMAAMASCGGTGSASTPTTVPSPTGHQLLAPAAAAALLDAPPTALIVIDVRTPQEFAAGHIAGAVDVDLNGASFQADVAKLDRDIHYFVYCHSGHRSAQAVAYMTQLGFGSIYELQGGISTWQSAGLPIVTS